MPWCEECARYLTPNSVAEDGSCPTCGDPLEGAGSHEHDDVIADESAPWHFKLLVFMTVAYLGWRFVEIFV